MSVSTLKNKLLEVVRRVEQGQSFEITKGGRPVALLTPRAGPDRAATGFARVEVKGNLDLPAAAWSYDVENLKALKKRKR
jgi:prevent-host-death family protein